MSRYLTGSTESVNRTTFPTVTGTAGTIGIWFRPDYEPGDGQRAALYWANGSTQKLEIQRYSDNNWYCGFETVTSRLTVADTGTFNSSAWNSVVFSWDDLSNRKYFYINSSLVATDTDVFSSTGFTAIDVRESLGQNGDGVTNYATNHRLAHFARWDAVLSPSERALFDAGYPSRDIAVESLLTYCRLYSTGSSEVDEIYGTDFAVDGAAATSANNPTTLPVKVHLGIQQIGAGVIG